MKIGIFGGTFDPIHLGHLELAQTARAQFSLNKVIFIPAYNPPHKIGLTHMASPPDRYEMVRLAIAGDSFFEISDCELNRQGVSYTIDTVKFLMKENPGAEFFLILGQDAYDEIDSWREAQELRRCVKFLVARRGLGKSERVCFPNSYSIQMPMCSISASGIRDAIKHGGKVDDYLPQAVLRYIRQHKLYMDS